MKFKISIIVFFAVCFFFAALTDGYAGEKPFRFSFESGFYKPSLKTLKRVLRDERLAIRQDPNFLLPGNVLDENLYERDIEVEGFDSRFSYGMGAEWNVYKRHSVFLSLSVWEDSISSSDIYPLPIINITNQFPAPRTARYDLEITQIWLGWKYDLMDIDNKVKIYTNIELFGAALIYLTQDVLLKVNAPSFGQSFATVSSTESAGTGYTSRFLLGTDYNFSPWFSVSLNGGYVLGRAIKLKIKRYFPASFDPSIELPDEATAPINSTLPVPPEKGEAVVFGLDTSQNTSRQLASSRNLPIELNGYHLNFALKFHF